MHCVFLFGSVCKILRLSQCYLRSFCSATLLGLAGQFAVAFSHAYILVLGKAIMLHVHHKAYYSVWNSWQGFKIDVLRQACEDRIGTPVFPQPIESLKSTIIRKARWKLIEILRSSSPAMCVDWVHLCIIARHRRLNSYDMDIVESNALHLGTGLTVLLTLHISVLTFSKLDALSFLPVYPWFSAICA
jgi:hypothetical protein